MSRILGIGGAACVVASNNKAIKYFQPSTADGFVAKHLVKLQPDSSTYEHCLLTWLYEVSIRTILGSEIGLTRMLEAQPYSEYGPYIVLELFPYNLFEYASTLGWDELCSFLLEVALPQILSQLRAMHQLGYLHADLKPTNILVDNTVKPIRVALTDFGSTVRLGTPASMIFTTQGYGHPDAGSCSQVGEGYDYYSLSIVIDKLLLWARRRSYDHEDELILPEKLGELWVWLETCEVKLQASIPNIPMIDIIEYPSSDRTPFIKGLTKCNPTIRCLYHNCRAKHAFLCEMLFNALKRRDTQSDSWPLEMACVALIFSLQGINPHYALGSGCKQRELLTAFSLLREQEDLLAIVRNYIVGYVLEARDYCLK